MSTEHTVIETCKYAVPDGTEANIERKAASAEVVLYEAKSGEELARKTIKAKPGRCPDAADFMVWKQAEEDKGTAWDQEIVTDLEPKLIEYLDAAMQRR